MVMDGGHTVIMIFFWGGIVAVITIIKTVFFPTETVIF